MTEKQELKINLPLTDAAGRPLVLDEAEQSKYASLRDRFSAGEIGMAWLTALIFIAAYLICEAYGIRYASLRHAKILYAVFLSINILSALYSLLAWIKIPSRSIAKDAIFLLTISMLSAALGNSIDYFFWITEVSAFKQSIFTNLLFILAILFSLPGIHLLGRVCRVEFSRQPVFHYVAIILIYVTIPLTMNSGILAEVFSKNTATLKEFVFGLLYAIGIGYLAAIAIHLWRKAQGRLYLSARLISLGMIFLSFGCSIYAGLFPRLPAAEIPSSPVHLIIALGYLLGAMGIGRTESIINTLFNLHDSRLPPWLPLVEVFGKSEGLEVYKRLESDIRATIQELAKAKEETQQKQFAISELEQEIQLRKETERALIVAKEKAEEANMAKAQFLAMMSHELKTPLTAIKGYGELLRGPAGNELLKVGKVSELADQIVLNADNLHGMIEGLLNFSLLETGKFSFKEEIFSLEKLAIVLKNTINNCLNSLNYIEKIDNPKLQIRADFHALQHICVNLLVNACKFCNEGSVTLEIRASGNKDLYIAVSDTGIGIAPENLAKIFEPFFQVSHGMRRRYGGAGLGLSIVKKIAADLSGKVLVESRAGQGTKFEVFIPDVLIPEAENE